jgi:8-oxo-dGTP diphosphatase
MTEYVLGFAFCKDYSGFNRVLLIRKNKPEWQAGKLNGVGGKVEETIDPTTYYAMTREFQEETGFFSKPAAWKRFAIMEFPEARVHCFTTVFIWEEFKKASSTTAELLEDYQFDEKFLEKMLHRNALPNIAWLVPMAYAAWWSTMPTLIIREEGALA